MLPSLNLSINPTLSILPTHHVHNSVLYVCDSIVALQIILSVHLPRFHIYVLVYDMLFSLSDLLHSV